MAKPYAVKPQLRDGRTYYIATFKTASGKRTCRGLGTDNHDTAELVCKGLVRLHNWLQSPAGSMDPAAAPLEVPAESVKLFWGQTLEHEDANVAAAVENWRLDAERIKHLSATVPPIDLAAHAASLAGENKLLRRQMQGKDVLIAELQRVNLQLAEEKEALERSVIVKTINSTGKAPTLAESRKAYETYMGTFTRGHRRDMLARLDAFLQTVSPEIRTSDVPVSAITKFVTAAALKGDHASTATRYTRVRCALGAFFNWAAENYEYVSQMSGVKKKPAQLVERERADIQWHELPEVKAAMQALPNDYWRALVGTLAFAGLRLSELIWLRVSDVHVSAERAKFWITTVVDSQNPEARHALKRENSRRSVDIHPKLLLPLVLDRLAQAKQAGQEYLFAMPPGMRRRRRNVSHASQRWLVVTLSTLLRGHVGGKKRKSATGLLPPGMNALSLRRTFGSLLLRSGKSAEDVAAAMGNTPAVVRKHYARIIGAEVDVDF